MSKIKVLMVLGSTNMGGAQMFILNFLRNLNLKDYQIDFAVNFKEKGGGIGDEIGKMGCRVYYLPYFKVYNYLGYVKAWKNFLSTNHYDIVHGHSTNSASIYLKIAKEMGCKTISHCHSAGFRGNLIQRFLKYLFTRNVGKYADYWFACSAKAASHLYGDNYSEYGRYYDIPNAINAEKYLYDEKIAKQIRRSLGVEDNEFLCGHVGSFTSPKNHIFLMNVFKEVLHLNPNAKFICCGTGELMDSVKEEAQKLNIIDKVIFPGVVHNCNEYLMAMDVFVFPSLFEGFPVSVIEAEATGLNVVMSDVITTEVDITDCINRLSLNDSFKKWAETVCYKSYQNRQSYNIIIANSKYNMATSAKMIERLYTEMVNN